MECITCKKPIEGTCVQVAGLSYHHDCFLCARCSSKLDSKVFMSDGKLICATCNYPKCCKCKEPIVDQKVTALDQPWHLACFCCTHCGASFEGGRYVKREADQLPYCTSCFDEHHAPRCHGCKKLAKTGALAALGQRWHPECLVCTTCHKPLPGKAIYQRDGHPYCEDHVSSTPTQSRRPAPTQAPGSSGPTRRKAPIAARPKSAPGPSPELSLIPLGAHSKELPASFAEPKSPPTRTRERPTLPLSRTMSDAGPATSTSPPITAPRRGIPSEECESEVQGSSDDGQTSEDMESALELLGSDAGKTEKAGRSSSRPHSRTLGRSLSEAEPTFSSPTRRRKRSKPKHVDGIRSGKAQRRAKATKDETSARRASAHLGHRRGAPEKRCSQDLSPLLTSDAVSSAVTTALEGLPWFKQQWAIETPAQKKQVLADVVNGLRSLGLEITASQVMKKEWTKMENDLSFSLPPESVASVTEEIEAIKRILEELLGLGMKIAEPVAVAASSKTLLKTIGGSPAAQSRSFQEKAVELREHFKSIVTLVRSHCSEELVTKPLGAVLKSIEEAPVRGRAKQNAINAKKDITGARARHHVALRLRGHLERLMSLVRQTCNTLSTVDGETGSMLHRTALELLAATQVIVKLTVKVQDLCATAQGLVLKARESASNLLKRSIEKRQKTPKKTRECNIWHFAPDENVRSNWPEGAATLNSLVLLLTSTEKIVDRSFLQTFILTYRSFTSPERLLAKLMERYNVPRSAREDKATVQLRVCVTLKYWIEHQIRDFSPELVDQLRMIIEQKLPADGNDKVAEMLQSALDNHIAVHSDAYNGSILPLQTASILDAPISPTDMLMNSTERDIAEQLTLISWEIFSSIDMHELLDGAWSNIKTRHTAPHVISLIKRFNQISFWVASTVLYSESLKERSMLISRWIKIAMIQKLRALNNFDGLMGVIAGLTLSPIDRLKFSKSTVHGELMDQFERFVAMMQPTNNWKLYREELGAAQLPKIPYLGMYLTDLIYIGDGNPDTLEDGRLINFRKRQMVYKVLDEISVQQSKPYGIKPLQPLTGCLLGLPALTEDQLYELSLRREPRGANMADVLR